MTKSKYLINNDLAKLGLLYLAVIGGPMTKEEQLKLERLQAELDKELQEQLGLTYT